MSGVIVLAMTLIVLLLDSIAYKQARQTRWPHPRTWPAWFDTAEGHNWMIMKTPRQLRELMGPLPSELEANKLTWQDVVEPPDTILGDGPSLV